MKKMTPEVMEELTKRIKSKFFRYNGKNPNAILDNDIAKDIITTVVDMLDKKTKKSKSVSKKSSGRVFAPITKEELAGKIVSAFCAKEYYSEEEYSEWVKDCGVSSLDLKNPVNVVTRNAHQIPLKHLTKQIEKDLSKVVFDTENIDCEDGFCYSKKIVGFQTLPNGLTYLGIASGGDWEMPLFIIIYWNGTALRGYIPTEGNLWNTDTKMAYGNGDCNVKYGTDTDNVNAMKRFGLEEYSSAVPNTEAIINDIQNRIKPSEAS